MEMHAPVSQMCATSAGTNTLTWQIWNNELTSRLTSYTASATTTNTWTGSTWDAWNEDFTRQANEAMGNITRHLAESVITATSTLTNSSTWVVWNQQLSNIRNASAEQVRAATARETARREENARIQVEHSQAKDRAERLLREHLSREQEEELKTKGHFHLELHVNGQRKRYRIERGRSRNVRQVDDTGRILKTLCAHPVAMVPDADTMLAQKLMLEGDEEGFLRIANHS